MGQLQIGVYVDADTWQQARSAYVVDLDLVKGSPDVYGLWVQLAIQRWAGLTPTGRVRKLSGMSEPAQSRGSSRMLALPVEVVTAMDEAIAADRAQTRRIVNRSQFVRQALQAATARSRARYGAQLPAAPARLPYWPGRARSVGQL